MSLKQIIKKLVPTSIRLKLSRIINSKQLYSLNKMQCETVNLLSSKEVNMENIFRNAEIQNSWKKWQVKLDNLKIPDSTGGVNPGDRRAIFFLTRYFKPKTLLEIGTHIGASTVNIASALQYNHIDLQEKPTLRTVDIRDVNSIKEKPWLQFGSNKSPIDMIENLELELFVEFVTNTSINYFEKSTEMYDFIFLDGDHAAKTVYKEIPIALSKLNKGGIILLHDYFPKGKPLWSNNHVIPGPYLATERHIAEGADIVILPLGSLPWPTKLNSNVTSLALLLKK